MPGRYLTLRPARSTAWKQLAGLGLVIGLERRVMTISLSYAVAIGLFALIVPLTVQELVNTFAYSIQPIMILTLALTILVGLVFIGFFRVFQTSAMETLFQRLYTRITIAMTEHLSRIREELFVPSYANYFGEAELMPRAVVVVLVVSGQRGVRAMHDMEPGLRQILLRRLCSKDESWSVIFVSDDPTIGEFVDRRVLAG